MKRERPNRRRTSGGEKVQPALTRARSDPLDGVMHRPIERRGVCCYGPSMEKLVKLVASALTRLETGMRCFSVSCNTPSSQISPHTVHIPCDASYVFGTGNKDILSPKLSIKRKHHAHCRCIATPSFHNRPITLILSAVYH